MLNQILKISNFIAQVNFAFSFLYFHYSRFVFLAEHIIHDVSRYVSYRDLCIYMLSYREVSVSLQAYSQNTSVIRANGMF